MGLYYKKPHCLTHWGRDKMVAIFQTTFSNGFSWMKMYEFRLTLHWSLFLGVQLTIFQHWFRYWLGADQATSHCLIQWWSVYWRIYASLGLNELMTRGSGSSHTAREHRLPNTCLNRNLGLFGGEVKYRADSRLTSSQWETSLQSNTVSYWLGANLISAPEVWWDKTYNIGALNPSHADNRTCQTC